MADPRLDGEPHSLTGLRRGGTVTALLFLYECVTEPPPQLRPIARHLGLTVQAVSHSYRQLSSQGLVEFRDGRYRATVEGVQWLHRAFEGLREDLDRRLSNLHVVRTTRAVAVAPVAAGSRVSLEMRQGVLSARPGGRSPSHGRARAAARAGELLEVEGLEGIVPIPRGRVHLVTLEPGEVTAPGLPERLGQYLRTAPEGLLAAQGLEAVHLLQQATERPVVQFAVGPTCAEASRLGVSSTVLLLESELPRILEQFGEKDPPPIDVTRLEAGAPRRAGNLRARSRRER